MEITPQTLTILGNLELRRYAGDLESIDESDQALLDELAEKPVTIDIKENAKLLVRLFKFSR